MRWVIAHRGAPTLATENTLSSFEAALRLGVEAVELDVHLTRDGRLAVHHDAALGRTVEGSGRVRGYTLAQLKAFPIRGAKPSERIPSLEEALDLCRGRCHVAVEGKSDVAEAQRFAKVLVRTLRRQGKKPEATVISFCHSLIGFVRSLAPEIPAGPSFESRHLPEAALYFQPAVVVMAKEIVEKRYLVPFSRREVPVWVYTVDDPGEWERVGGCGAAGIITNRPDLFARRKTRAKTL